MGTKLKRIPQQDLVTKAANYLNTEFSIVLTSGSVYYGSLVSANKETLHFKNSRNDRFEFAIKEIQELITSA